MGGERAKKSVYNGHPRMSPVRCPQWSAGSKDRASSQGGQVQKSDLEGFLQGLLWCDLNRARRIDAVVILHVAGLYFRRTSSQKVKDVR